MFEALKSLLGVGTGAARALKTPKNGCCSSVWRAMCVCRWLRVFLAFALTIFRGWGSPPGLPQPRLFVAKDGSALDHPGCGREVSALA